MIRIIVQAVKEKLKENFMDYEVYDEEMKQGFVKPCFFVQGIAGTRKQEVQSYQDTIDVDIQCLLAEDNDNKNAEYEAIRESFYSLLEYLKINDSKIIRGTQMNFAIKDGVFHFYITYRYYRQKQDISLDKMNLIDVKGCVK